MSERMTPGPWFFLPWYMKAYRWVRYQPRFKIRALGQWLRYWLRWHREYKHLPIDPVFTPDRSHPRGGVCPTPAMMWEITVAEDADKLERYYIWNR